MTKTERSHETLPYALMPKSHTQTLGSATLPAPQPLLAGTLGPSLLPQQDKHSLPLGRLHQADLKILRVSPCQSLPKYCFFQPPLHPVEEVLSLYFTV